MPIPTVTNGRTKGGDRPAKWGNGGQLKITTKKLGKKVDHQSADHGSPDREDLSPSGNGVQVREGKSSKKPGSVEKRS